MKKLHQNLFYYYRGGNRNDKDIQEQLENNVTKAFVNVLEKSSLNLQKKIIREIIHFPLSKNIDKINYTLQETTIGEERIKKIRKRCILGISPEGVVDKNEGRKYLKSSKPDAWIWSNDFVILIENKIQGNLDEAQLKKHNELIDGDIQIKSWKKDIYPIFKKTEKEQLNSKDKLLVQEFNEFLDMVGLTEFTGFEKKDLVRMYSEEEDEVDYVEKKFKKLGDIIAIKLSKKGLHHHGHRSKPDDWWDYFVRDTKRSYYTYAHFSIYTSDLFLGVKFHLQSHTPDFTIFKKKLRNEPDGFSELIKKLKKSKVSYEIELTDREHIGGYDTESGFCYTIYSKYLDNDKINLLIDLILNKVLPEKNKMWLSIRRDFNISEAEKLEDKMVDEILETIDDWWDVYQYIIK
jgi:hypothetical protein